MINLNATSGSAGISNVNIGSGGLNKGNAVKQGSGFGDTVKAVENQFAKVDDMQQASDVSITDLLSGKNEDITSVVSQVAKADMSFKLLVGVRNKLVEAYKQTMNMPL